MRNVLRINGYFLLPDDFDGTFDDAVKIMLDAIRAERPDLPPALDASFNISPEAFYLNQRKGFSYLAETGVWRLDQHWEFVDGRPKDAHVKSGVWIK